MFLMLFGAIFHHFPQAVDFSIDLSCFDLESDHLEADEFVTGHLAGGVPLCRRVRRRGSAAACQEPSRSPWFMQWIEETLGTAGLQSFIIGASWLFPDNY